MGLLEVDVATWSIIVGALVTALTSLVTTLNASPKVKTLVNLALAGVAGVFAAAAAATGEIHWGELMLGAFLSWITSVVSYKNISTPLQIDSWIKARTPNFGFGEKTAA